jgi:group II intron reverse transcriptase/maturase
LERLREIIVLGQTSYVVEADIKGFFNNVHHEHMMRFLKHRVTDTRLLRTVGRCLKAGIMEDGAFTPSERGTPQGGLVSPVLSNIYLHYVLDLWFTRRFAKACRGSAQLVRYADDFVGCFQFRDDAERFLQQLKERLAAFGLEIEPTKTRILSFGRFAAERVKESGRRRPETFTFLGFTHYCSRTRAGKYAVGRRTDKTRFRAKLHALSAKLKALRLAGGKAMVVFTQQHLRGHIQYYGVSGNYRLVACYLHHAERHLFRWLNKRSQKRSLTWAKFFKLRQEGLLPHARIVHGRYSSAA